MLIPSNRLLGPGAAVAETRRRERDPSPASLNNYEPV